VITLDGSASSDPRALPLTFEWTLSAPLGSRATLLDATTATPSFTVDIAGAYVATLRVSDGTFPSSLDSVTLTAADETGYVHVLLTTSSGPAYAVCWLEGLGELPGGAATLDCEKNLDGTLVLYYDQTICGGDQ